MRRIILLFLLLLAYGLITVNYANADRIEACDKYQWHYWCVNPTPVPEPSWTEIIELTPSETPTIPQPTETPTPQPSESPLLTPSPLPSQSVTPPVQETPTPSTTPTETALATPTPTPKETQTMPEDSPNPTSSATAGTVQPSYPTASASATIISPTLKPLVVVSEQPTLEPSISKTVPSATTQPMQTSRKGIKFQIHIPDITQIGNDMTPEQRKESQQVVIGAIVVGQIARRIRR